MNNHLTLGGTLCIEDKYLLAAAVSKDFQRITDTTQFTYYNFTVANGGDNHKRFGVWANGVLVETPSKNQFTNHWNKHPYYGGQVKSIASSPLKN